MEEILPVKVAVGVDGLVVGQEVHQSGLGSLRVREDRFADGRVHLPVLEGEPLGHHEVGKGQVLGTWMESIVR